MTTSSTNTIRLHRVFTAPPERVYRAFLDAAAMCKWLPPNGFTGTVHHLDAKVGGTYKMSFTNFSTGNSHSFGGEYLELIPNELIRHSDRFDDPNLPGEMQTTITLKKVLVGTEVNIVQEGVPAVIPPEACYVGWQESLTLLAQLVQPEIPDPPSGITLTPPAAPQPWPPDATVVNASQPASSARSRSDGGAGGHDRRRCGHVTF